ncbi:hypothetical protein BBP00_00009660 [Phytophthora kernoviae]|uniref:Uncharacterized protein n=1 Tax=Phytophthora kernoviae TaxID=325452 RepID=A0A3F2RD78_9STRA|nr:hypothetical protein BBP00_00009660 [Phytophthora kernoviae]
MKVKATIGNGEEKTEYASPSLKLSAKVEADGFVLPDNITDLCQFLDDGGGVELPPAAEQEEEVLRRKNEQIRRLKMEKRALKRDLERSRRVGNELEADLNRLQRQRRKELIDARHAQRSLGVREKKVADREQACNNLQEDVLCLKGKLSEEIRAYEHNEVIVVVENLVESVELSAKTDANINKMQEEEWRVTEELVAVKQQLSNEHEEFLTAELEASQLRLQDEQHTCTQLGTVCALQLGELACKTAWLESVTLANVPLKSRLSAKIEEIGEIEAERDDWQHQTNQLQREREAFQAEQVKQQNRIQAECLKLQNELRTAQLRELRSQQQLRIA